MTVYLKIPRAPTPIPATDRIIDHGRQHATTLRLKWTANHPMSSYRLGVLIDAAGEVFDLHQYRHLQQTVGAWIEAEDMTRVNQAMGLPA